MLGSIRAMSATLARSEGNPDLSWANEGTAHGVLALAGRMRLGAESAQCLDPRSTAALCRLRPGLHTLGQAFAWVRSAQKQFRSGVGEPQAFAGELETVGVNAPQALLLQLSHLAGPFPGQVMASDAPE